MPGTVPGCVEGQRANPADQQGAALLIQGGLRLRAGGLVHRRMAHNPGWELGVRFWTHEIEQSAQNLFVFAFLHHADLMRWGSSPCKQEECAISPAMSVHTAV